MKVTANLKNLRMTPRKVRLLADMIRGLDTNVALVQLNMTAKKGSEPVRKLLQSAIANAEHNFGLDRDNLFVSEIHVGDAFRLKRWLPKAYGRASLLLKRNSHIFLTLDERIEGKNRKSKEQLEKERKERMEAKLKLEKEMAKEREEESKTEEKAGRIKQEAKEGKAGAQGAKDGKWMKKIFQRKSM